MKRIIAILLLLTMCLGLLNGCKSAPEDEEALAGDFVTDIGGEETPDTPEKEDEQPSEEQKPSEDQPEQKPSEDQPEQKPADGGDKPEQKPSEDQPEQKPADGGDQSTQKPEGGDSETVTPSPEEEAANLYQSSTLSSAIGYDGKNVKNTDYTVSKAIEVKGGDSLTFGPMASAQVVMGYIYDDAGKPLAIINARTAEKAGEFPEGMKLYTYSVPAGAKSAKFSVHNDSKGDFVVARNNKFDMAVYTELSGTLATFIDNPLKDRKGLFVGDSITIATRDEKMDGMKGWPRRIADSYGMDATNNGKSGVSVSNKRSQGTVLTQLLQKKTEDYDYVVLHGGVNDAWSLVDVGEMEESFNPDMFDPATFAGGLELLIYNAILYFGDTASIGYLINFKTPSFEKGRCNDMTEYNEMAIKICEKWGITYFDMYNHPEITRDLKMTTLTHTTDYLHPSTSGYDVISPYIGEYMTTMLPCKQEILNEVLKK